MDLTKLIESLTQGGNTWLILAVVVFLMFKDKIFPPKTPAPTQPPAPAPTPAPTPAPSPPIEERPVLELIKLLAPILLDIFKKGAAQKSAELEQEKADPK